MILYNMREVYQNLTSSRLCGAGHHTGWVHRSWASMLGRSSPNGPLRMCVSASVTVCVCVCTLGYVSERASE